MIGRVLSIADQYAYLHCNPNSPAFQRSLTSTAASKVKKAFSLKSPGSGSGLGQGKPKRPLTVGELMRNHMRVSEAMDSRVRRALLRISAGQVAFISIICIALRTCALFSDATRSHLEFNAGVAMHVEHGV